MHIFKSDYYKDQIFIWNHIWCLILLLNTQFALCKNDLSDVTVVSKPKNIINVCKRYLSYIEMLENLLLILAYDLF